MSCQRSLEAAIRLAGDVSAATRTIGTVRPHPYGRKGSLALTRMRLPKVLVGGNERRCIKTVGRSPYNVTIRRLDVVFNMRSVAATLKVPPCRRVPQMLDRRNRSRSAISPGPVGSHPSHVRVCA